MKFSEIAPPGREKQVKKLKKKFDDPGAAYAIAWAQHNKHGKPKKKESLGESDDTTYVKMVIQKYPQEWQKFMQTGDLMDAPNIYEKLFVYFHFDTGEMPYGTAKARDGDPYEWIANKLDDLGLVEGKMSEIDLDIKTLSDAEFEKKYGKSKGQMQKDLNEDDVNEADDKEKQLKAWYYKYNKYMGNNGDKLADGFFEAYLDTGILTDATETNEFAKAVDDVFGGDTQKAEEELFGNEDLKKKHLPITYAMHEEFEKIMGAAVGATSPEDMEDNVHKAARILGDDVVGFDLAEDVNEADLNAWYAEQYAKELAEKEGKTWSKMKYGEQEAYRKIANKKYGVVKSENADVPTQKGRDAKPNVLTKRAMNVVKKQIKKDANKERRRMDKDAVEEAPFGKAVKSALGRVANRTATAVQNKLGSIPGMGNLKTVAKAKKSINNVSDQVWNDYLTFKQTKPDSEQVVAWFQKNHQINVSDIVDNPANTTGEVTRDQIEDKVKTTLAKQQSGTDKQQQPNQYQFKKGDEIKWTDSTGKQQTAKVIDPDKGPGDQQNMMTVQQGNRGTIALSKDKPFPADSEATQDDKVAIAQLQKIDPTANQTTLRAVNSVAGGKPISGQLQQFIQPLMKKISRALKDANKRQKLAIALSESLSQTDLSKLDMLAREGLVDKKNVSRFKTAMRMLAKGKDLPISYKDDVIEVVSKLSKIITKPSVMGMIRKGLKEQQVEQQAQEKFKTWVNQANDIIS